MNEFNELLEKAGIIDFSFKKLRDDDRFNIFTILRNRDEEVGLHSRFLFELLNPKGSHNKQDEFLKLWLDVLEITDFSLDNVLARRERGSIDILLTNRNRQAIIIENKIWAEDQLNQLERYHTHVSRLGFKILKVVAPC